MKVTRGTTIGFGVAALLLAAAVLPASAGTKPATAQTAAPKTGADKPASGKAPAGKTANGKSATGKAGTGKTAKDKAAAGKDADKDAVAAPRAMPRYPPSPAFKSWLADAATDSFYLVLDPRAGTLKLVLGGVEMRSYAVSNIEVATPRRFGAPEPLPANWHERVYTNAVIDPPHPGARTEIVGPEVGTAEEKVLVPPTPEEAIPVPALYRIRFDQGLALELTGGVAEQKGELPPAELPRGFREKIRQLREGYQDPLRLRLQLQPDAYAEVYRMLPPGTDFIILHNGR